MASWIVQYQPLVLKAYLYKETDTSEYMYFLLSEYTYTPTKLVEHFWISHSFQTNSSFRHYVLNNEFAKKHWPTLLPTLINPHQLKDKHTSVWVKEIIGNNTYSGLCTYSRKMYHSATIYETNVAEWYILRKYIALTKIGADTLCKLQFQNSIVACTWRWDRFFMSHHERFRWRSSSYW